MDIRVLILDFDGVLVDSVGIKDAAFRELFKDHPGALDRIMSYHVSHNATIRYEKFRHITEQLLGQDYTPERETALSERYSRYVFQAVVDAPYVEGALEFLKEYAPRYPLYVATVNPEEEFKDILAARQMTHFFRGIYTHPWKKAAALKDILSREGITAGEAVFIGDSPEDYRSAREAGVRFIGRDSGKPIGDAGVPLCRDFAEITGLLSAEMQNYPKGCSHERLS